MRTYFLKKSLFFCLILGFNQAKSEIPDAEFRQFFYDLSGRLGTIERRLDYLLLTSQSQQTTPRSVLSCDNSFKDCSLFSGFSASAKASGKASLSNTGDLSASAIRSSSIRPPKTDSMGSPTSPSIIRRSPSPRRKDTPSSYNSRPVLFPAPSSLRKRTSSSSIPSSDSLSFLEVLSDSEDKK